MKLESKFFKLFFFPFLTGIILSTLIVTIFLGIFTNKYLDKRTSENIINLEKNYSKININSINILLSTSIEKLQIGMNELILFYQRMATELLNSKKDYEFNSTILKCILDLDDNYCLDNPEETTYTAVWMLDDETTEENLNDISKKDVKNQLIAFNYIIPNIDTVLEANRPNAECYYFHFEKTELYTSYPISSDCEDGFFELMKEASYEEDLDQCLNEEGEYYTYFKFKCEYYFVDMLKSKSKAYDNNFINNENKTIFITNYYGPDDEYLDRELTMCIEFYDPITEGKAYICADFYCEDINDFLENLNANIPGYFFIANIGFNHAFYFPQNDIEPKTLTDNIFTWDLKYILEEKVFFYNKIRKMLSSNYLNNLGNNSVFDEIFVNGINNTEQYFFIDGKKNEFAIYPILLYNLNGQKEHVFSIIYIYNDQLYFEKINKYISSLTLKIILELLIFIIFGSGLLYIIYLTFNNLSKHIVIPIKNVNYMLKGINIGGKNRLKYLNYLKQRNEENLEKLEKMYLLQNDNNKNLLNAEIQSDIINNQKINIYSDFDKTYEEESNFIEKEISFYDFDEQLLQFRPLEIEQLVESLIEIKSALYLTSEDQNVDKIILYSKSDNIFSYYKNKEGSTICQSNIGNLQSQLLEFDKAIYHLALSLQDNKLIKYIRRNLNDEYDESDSLLNKIAYLFNKNKKEEKNNIIVEKQINNAKDNFSKKIIDILINTRYCRLIHAYYMFFKNLKKIKKLNNNNTINGQFINTKFHTINYYHKIIIQFIYLSYIKNDLIKIGESVLDYIEFLIKFKFKTKFNDEYYLKIHNLINPKSQKKKEFKKIIFNKIIKWFNLFDDYITYIKDNTSLNDTKNIVDDYSHNINTENKELNLESQSAFMFRINIQKSDFLKGKFCFYCKNYNDALFYFIRAAKKRSLVSDGLIKKKSLKRIYKLLNKMKKKFEKLKLKHLNMGKELSEHYKEIKKIISNNKKNTLNKKNENNFINVDNISFGEEIKNIDKDIIKDINECNSKQEKDIIILIDFNIYEKKEENIYDKLGNIDSFIDQTLLILNNYLSSNDRLAVFIYYNEYQIICPLMYINTIDSNTFSKDLFYYKNNIFEINKETEEYDINSTEFNLEGNNINIQSHENSLEISDKEENNYNKIKGLVKTINYINYYLKMKEEVKNEKYIILFSDLININIKEDENIKKFFDNLNRDKNIIFILVGKNKISHLKHEKCNKIKNEKIILDLLLNKFGDKSEIINFENMKKIKTILSNNSVIKDEIVYPNEIYK